MTGSESKPARKGSIGHPEAHGDARWPRTCCADGPQSSDWPRSEPGGGMTGADPVMDLDTEAWNLEDRDRFGLKQRFYRIVCVHVNCYNTSYYNIKYF